MKKKFALLALALILSTGALVADHPNCGWSGYPPCYGGCTGGEVNIYGYCCNCVPLVGEIYCVCRGGRECISWTVEGGGTSWLCLDVQG